MMYIVFYLGGILLANLLVHWFGLIHVGLLVFPAGAILIGLTFSARDFVQQKYGKWQCWIWMVVASLITLLFNKQLAFASIASFLVAEGLDWLIYIIFEHHPMSHRIIASNIISTPIDSAVFVSLAFGFGWQPIIGQTIVKFVSSMLVLPFLKYSKYRG